MKQTGQLDQGKLFLMILFVTFLIAVIPNVNAFAVSTPHWDTNPLHLSPGESTIVPINLQNKAPADNDDLIAKVELSSKNNIARLVTGETVYDLPYGSDTNVLLEVTIPNDAVIGEEYDVRFSATSSKKVEVASGVGMNIAAVISFPVIVVEETSYEEIPAETTETIKEEKSTLGFIASIILLVVIIIIIVVITKAKERNSEKSKRK